MLESFEVFLKLLGQFTGTGGGAEHPIVQFGLAAIFWTILLAVVKVKHQERNEPHDRWLIWAFSIALARELFMVGVKVLEAYEFLSADQLHVFFPPLEHALSNIALVMVAAAFVYYLTQQRTLAQRYLVASVTCVSLVYLATFWWWAQFILANPESKFGQTWCDWAFRINASVWLAVPIGYLWLHIDGWKRNVVCSALALFFLNEFLKLPDMALGERYEHVFAPIRHAFYIAAIPLLGYVYIKELAIELKQTLLTLEERVDARTNELKGALDELEVANAHLIEASRTDPLTGIANRRLFLEASEKECQRSSRDSTSLAMLMLDADHFKRINDTYGHTFGDQVLIRIAETIDDECRRNIDTVARYGGEEFIALLPETDSAGALEVAERIRMRVEKLAMTNNGELVKISISIGVASTIPDNNLTVNWLIGRADDAMYKAKRTGRNRVATDLELEHALIK